MPYSVPSPPHSPSSPSRPTVHRRSRSCSASLSDDKGPGAFVSLGPLPKRKSISQKFVVHDHSDEHISPPPKSSLFISLPSSSQEPGSIPFPSSSSQLSPLQHFSFPANATTPSLPPPSSYSNTSLPRSSSSPIILSNGKPLKPSLKSASSSPRISHIAHLRAQSAPSSPSVPKNVHFAESGKDLETVRVYNRSGKPASLSNGSEDTETETEADGASYFTLAPLPQKSLDRLPLINPSVTSDIPCPSPNPYANIHLESISLPKSRPTTLYGSILVRNIAFEKHVALRFTLDGWQTTSEVLCKHVVTLPALPPPFPKKRTVGDVVGLLAAHDRSSSVNSTWDRFSFAVQLEYYEPNLTEQTLWLVGRFTCPIGEWWDNNDGKNYRVGFKRAVTSPAPSFSPSEASVLHSQQKSFTAPSTMKSTPVTPMVAIQTSVFPFPVFSSGSSSSSITPTLSPSHTPVVPATAKPTDASWSSSKSPVVNSPRPSRPSSLAQRRGFGDTVKISPSLSTTSLTNYASPSTGEIQMAQMQTPTPPRSRSGSLENFMTEKIPNSKNEQVALANPASTLLTSPRSSPFRNSSPPKALKNAQLDSSQESSAPLTSMPTAPSQSVNDLPSTDLRAALVKQWCFARSSPRTSGVLHGSHINSPIVDRDVTPATEDFRGLSGGSPRNGNGNEKGLKVRNDPSPTSENGYAWWISGGRVDSSKSNNGDGWFTWSGDAHSHAPQGTSVGVEG